MTDLYNEILDYKSMNFDREQLIQDYIDNVLDNMSTKDLMRIFGEQLADTLSTYGDEELITEIGEHYPELVEGIDTV